MFSKFTIGDSSQCTCGQGPQTAEHILQDCRQHNALRSLHWPVATTLERKLYSTLQELQTTVQYIHQLNPPKIQCRGWIFSNI
jgi:hypothetical protein